MMGVLHREARAGGQEEAGSKTSPNVAVDRMLAEPALNARKPMLIQVLRRSNLIVLFLLGACLTRVGLADDAAQRPPLPIDRSVGQRLSNFTLPDVVSGRPFALYGLAGLCGLPEAILNFMALIGWSPGEGDEQEIFTFDELKRVLTYPMFGLDEQRISTAVAALEPYIEWVSIDPERAATLRRCSDRDDQKFLETALCGNADALLTYDRALLKMRRRMPFPVLQPEQWAELPPVTTASGA